MSTVEFRTASASIEAPLGPVSADSVEFNAEANRNTNAKFTAYSGKEAGRSATSVFSGEAAAKMGEAQKLGFSRRQDPDTTITLDDGTQTKSYRMFLTGPSYSLTTGNLVPGFLAVERAALLSNLKLDIYTTYTGREGGNTGPFASPTGFLADEAESPNLAERLKELTQRCVQYWLDNANNGGLSFSASSATLKSQQHLINFQGPIQVWYRMLENSVESLSATADWLGPISKQKSVNRQLNSEIVSILRGTSRDFQEIIDALCDTFQLMVIPSPTGNAPKFILQSEVVLGEAEELQLPASSILLDGDVSADLLPVQQVLIRGTPHLAYLFDSDPSKLKTDEGSYFVGGFPDLAPSASGDVAILPLPSFIQEAVDVSVSEPLGDLPPDINAFSSGLSNLKNIAVEYTSRLAEKLIKGYAKSAYVNLALGGSSTSITLPMNLELWPGKRYRVTNAAGELLFTGFLSSVKHALKKQTGGTGQATTTCGFTHILFPGFTLPGI